MRIEAPRDEIVSLTSLRGIAALFVVLHHYAAILQPTVDLDDHTMFFRFGGVWVSFFFLLSGYILSEVYYDRMAAGRTDTRRFLIARLIRIYPLHLFMLLVMLGAEFFKLALEVYTGADVGAFSEKNSIASFFANLFLVQTWGLGMDLTWNSPAWSISVEWFCYLLFPLVLLTRIVDRVWSAALVAMVSCLYWALEPEIVAALQAAALPIDDFRSLFSGIVLFMLGMALHRLARDFKLPADLWLSIVQIAVFVSVIYLLHVGTKNWYLLPLFVLLVLSTREDRGALCAFLKLQPVYRLGVISYSVYLTHMLFLMALSPDLDQFVPALGALRDTVLGAWLLFAAAIAATLAFSVLTYQWIELRPRKALSARFLAPVKRPAATIASSTR